jgi:phosphonatase-like hydrolase
VTTTVRLVVFDLAGTTVDDGAQVVEAFTTALRPHGVTPSANEINRVRGASKREALSRLLPSGPDHQGRADRAYSAFRRQLLAAYQRTPVTPMAGASALFERLRRSGTRIALNTGFDRQMTEAILSHVEWSFDTFDVVVSGDDVPGGRPAPYMIFRAMEGARVAAVHEVMTVGDTVNDLWAGFNAGVRWNVGVLSGAHDRIKLQEAPHTDILSSVAALDSLLEKSAWIHTRNA